MSQNGNKICFIIGVDHEIIEAFLPSSIFYFSFVFLQTLLLISTEFLSFSSKQNNKISGKSGEQLLEKQFIDPSLLDNRVL